MTRRNPDVRQENEIGAIVIESAKKQKLRATASLRAVQLGLKGIGVLDIRRQCAGLICGLSVAFGSGFVWASALLRM